MMLVVSTPLSYKNERGNYDLFQDFPDGNLIDTIDFDDFFEGINDGDLLQNLKILDEFDISKNNTTTNLNVKTKSKENDKSKKSSSQIKNPEGKKKVKKYRAHRKHLLAREAEAASWTQRKQMYDGAIAIGGGGKRVIMNPWSAPPTMGFPPMAHHIRPLHVWGHPYVNNSFWHPHYQGVPNSLAPGTPCFPSPTRFAAALMVPGVPPPFASGQTPHLHPTKESIDAAIEDVLSKPQTPLPIGLKPPSIDSVLNELQCQGITKIPPT
ncbi:transcription activator GLK1-like isoform X3 [Capsicum annuum]|uniref:transcription activator GLK1-like isoform X3 n=1 Tax=Capsicum annuum TaxID=4072 RepID=UPI001FB060EF|nr:transcription activator GLK1-like isoform X3 [Capsicum annuum]XP_047253144.1 transcription activator GLK1-like isoform X3 [Capsicum annuum]